MRRCWSSAVDLHDDAVEFVWNFGAKILGLVVAGDDVFVVAGEDFVHAPANPMQWRG